LGGLPPRFFDIWMRLLRQVEGSVLWLLQTSEAATRNLCDEARARGVDPSRLVFAPKVDVSLHLARHRLADLFLDNLPVSAHTAASDVP
jgi:protein O-GlcNAc transferase